MTTEADGVRRSWKEMKPDPQRKQYKLEIRGDRRQRWDPDEGELGFPRSRSASRNAPNRASHAREKTEG